MVNEPEGCHGIGTELQQRSQDGVPSAAVLHRPVDGSRHFKSEL